MTFHTFMLTGVCAVAASASALAPASLAAQRPIERVAADHMAADTRARAESTTRGMGALITIELDGVLLKDALRAVGRQADINMTLAEPVLSLSSRVTISAKSRRAADVLRDLLRGTDVVMTVTSDGHAVFSRPESARKLNGTIVGKVVNGKTKQAMVGVTVLLDDATKGVITGDDGTFRISASAGEHQLTARMVGFTKQTRITIVVENETATVDFTLAPSASVLDEVIVTGTVVATERKAIPTPITVISAEDIEKRGITRIDQLFRGEVPGLLALERGIENYSASGLSTNGMLGGLQASRVYSRGSASLGGEANPLKTYVDGVELADPSYLGTIDPKSIERIEIITGPQAATIYGSGAMGGVMQIFTKKGGGSGTPDLTLTIQYGLLQNNLSSTRAPMHNHSALLSGGSGPSFTYSGTLSYLFSGQWQPGLYARRYGASVGMTHTRGPFTASGSVSTTAGQNGTTFGGGTFFRTVGADDYMGTPFQQVLYGEGLLSSSRGTPNTHQISTSTSQTVSLNLDYRLSSFWQHHATVGRTQNTFALKPQAPEFIRGRDGADTLFNASRSVGLRTTASYNTTFLSPRVAGLTSTLTVGLNGSWGDQMSVTGCLATAASTTYVGCNLNNAWSATPVNVTQPVNDESWGGFASWQVGVLDHLYFTFGLRGERNPTYGRDHTIDWTPTNGATYTIEHGDVTLKLLASYGRSTRPPSELARFAATRTSEYFDPSVWTYQFANPDLTPEYSRGPQGGFELYYGNLLSLTVNHYSQRVTDLIQTVTVDSFPAKYIPTGEVLYIYQSQYRNVARIRQFGWEGTGSVNVGPLSVKGTYSWNDSRITYSSYTIASGFVGLPTHTGNVTVGYAAGKTSVTLATNYVGSMLTYGSNATIASVIRGSARLRMYVDRRTPEQDLINTTGYVKSDLGASQRLNDWASLTLNVTNLGNNFSSDASEIFPSLGRQTLFGLSLRTPRR